MPARFRLPALPRIPVWCRLALGCLPLWLAACGNDAAPFYQGYVEGEFVYMAASQAGRLQALRVARGQQVQAGRSEEHTSELQSLMRISYAVFCLQKKKINRHKDKSETQ